ncbi:MAG: MFS transporter [candidate division Zixibacteria bacterium]|nr:MFS transporter [candidate division Zixibacteria bacterium]
MNQEISKSEQKNGTLFLGIKKNIFFLGLVSFLTDVSSDMVYPLLPVFLTEVLGSSKVFVGLIEGIAESTASILKIFSGWFSDKIGKRKPIVILGYSLSSISKPLLALVTSAWQVLFIRFADRTGKGIRTSPRDALIAETSDGQRRGASFGLHRAMDSAGAILGPLLAFVLLPLLNKNYRHLFLLASIPAFFSILVLFVWVKEAKTRKEKVPLAEKKASFKFGAKFKLFVLVVALFTLGNSSDAFLFLRAKSLGVNLVFIPLLWGLFNLVYTLSSTPAGVLSDKIGRRKIILFGFLVYGLSYLGFAFANRSLHVWILFAIYGVYYGLTDGALRAFVADLVKEKDKRGTAYGFYHGAVGFCALPASLILGYLWQTFGAHVAFSFGAVLALLAGVIFYIGFSEKDK